MATKQKAAPKAPAATDDDAFSHLRLIELGLTNFQRVKAVRIRPVGNVTMITGRNGQGKSSILDGLFSLFAGKASLHRKPIREGETEGQVWADLGHDGKPALRVTRHFKIKADGGELATHITVEAADGRKLSTPQAVADGLYAPIAMDPLAFLRMPDKDKVEVLKGLVTGFDFDAAAAKRKALFEDRTAAGRLRDQRQAAAKSIVLPPGPKSERFDAADFGDQLSTALEHNATVDARARRRKETADSIEARRDQIETLEAELTALKKAVEADAALLRDAAPLPDKVDVASLQARLEQASAINAAADKHEQRDRLEAEAKDAADAYGDLTEEIETLDRSRVAAIAAAKIPVEGLAFDEDGVTLDGLPFEQASTAGQLKASTLLAMATSPGLRVAVVREGSLLDAESLKVLADMAEAHDFDVLVERVTNGEKVGIVIEDGEVAS